MRWNGPRPPQSLDAESLSMALIELEARDALSGRGDCWFSKFSQLAAINKGLQDVLLHVEIVVVDGRHGLAEGGKVFQRFVDAVIVDVVPLSFQ